MKPIDKIAEEMQNQVINCRDCGQLHYFGEASYCPAKQHESLHANYELRLVVWSIVSFIAGHLVTISLIGVVL